MPSVTERVVDMFVKKAKKEIRPLFAAVRAPRPAKIKVCGTAKRPLAYTFFALSAACALLLALFISMDALRTDVETAEWWTTHIQAGWEKFAGTLSSVFPFSVFEFCVTALILAGVYLVVRFFMDLYGGKFRRIAAGALSIATAALCVLDLYIMSMGFGYYRYAMPLPQAGGGYDAEQAVAAVEYFLNDYNALAQKFERDENGNVVCPYTFGELSELLIDEYARIYDGYMLEYTPAVKPILNSWLLSDVLIIGITFLPTGEANVNIDAPTTQMVATMAHELAHTKGIQREGDANLISQYLLISSPDDYLRYCGYFETFGQLASAVMLAGDKENYIRLSSAVHPLIGAERRFAREYWNAQPDITGKIGEFFNDVYLKLNGATNGTGSYDDGNKTDVITPIDPDTGEPETDPDTGAPIVIPVYSSLQKLYFYLYEQRCAAA